MSGFGFLLIMLAIVGYVVLLLTKQFLWSTLPLLFIAAVVLMAGDQPTDVLYFAGLAAVAGHWWVQHGQHWWSTRHKPKAAPSSPESLFGSPPCSCAGCRGRS